MPIAIWKKLKFDSIEKFKETLFCYYWQKLLSQREISEKLNCDITVIENWFKRLDIPRRQQQQAIRNTKTKHIYIPDSQLKVFDGLMISDMHIEEGSFQSRASFGVKHLEFATKITKELNSLLWNKILFNKTSLGWYARSSFSIELQKQRNRWYKNSIKIVPEDIRISPTMMLWWYLGDGYITKYGAMLCTDSFLKEDNIRLVSLINEQEIPCHLTKRNRIRIEGNGGTQKLLSYIGRSPVICYQYKWGEYC